MALRQEEQKVRTTSSVKWVSNEKEPEGDDEGTYLGTYTEAAIVLLFRIEGEVPTALETLCFLQMLKTVSIVGFPLNNEKFDRLIWKLQLGRYEETICNL